MSMAEIFWGRQETLLVLAKKFGLNYTGIRELLKATFPHISRGWLQDDCEGGNLEHSVTEKLEHY